MNYFTLQIIIILSLIVALSLYLTKFTFLYSTIQRWLLLRSALDVVHIPDLTLFLFIITEASQWDLFAELGEKVFYGN